MTAEPHSRINLLDYLFRLYDIDRLDNRDEAFIAWTIDLLEKTLWRYFQPVVAGIERIPAGAALYVGNHSGALLTPDSFLFGVAAYRAHGVSAIPYGLGHEWGIRLPLIHQFVMPIGAIRAGHENALRIFAAGHKALVYPGGDLDSMRPYRDRNRVVFGGRRGYIRLALRGGVPIVPLVSCGSHETLLILDDGRWLARALGIDRLFRTKVWPITLSLPWGLTIGPPPPHFPLPTRIYVEVLEPICFERRGEEAAADEEYVAACDRQVHGAMSEALQALAARRASGSDLRGLG